MDKKLAKFLEKSKKVHGDKYDYSKVEYKGSNEKVCIICPIHGEFWQTPVNHVRGYECQKCANIKRGKNRMSKEEFIKRSKEIHGDEFDYSKVEYINIMTSVTIICKKHGEFKQIPIGHLSGHKCPKCKNFGLTNTELIEKFKEIHGSKYDYSKVSLKKMNDKVEIICPIHGSFLQSPTKHLIGQGCPKCGVEKRSNTQFLNKEIFIKRAKNVHGEIYDYSKVEDELCSIIEEYIGNGKIKRNDRTVLKGKELDIYIPSMKIGIEYNGLLWHSEEYGKDCHYHLDKTLECNNNGIKLIHIFEDEWNLKKEIVLNKILHLLGHNKCKKKIMARKCTIEKIGKQNAKEFLEKYHIQGYGKSTINYGCFYEKELIGVMSFLEHKENKWELVRFANNYNYVCSGIGGKLFSYFIKENKPFEVKTFADRRWTIDKENNLYEKIGFTKEKYIKPDYRYIKISSPSLRIHKFNFRKKTLSKRYDLPLSLTESEMVKNIGYSKIWDCGLIKYVWKQKTC